MLIGSSATTQVAFDLWQKTMETHQREIQIDVEATAQVAEERVEHGGDLIVRLAAAQTADADLFDDFGARE